MFTIIILISAQIKWLFTAARSPEEIKSIWYLDPRWLLANGALMVHNSHLAVFCVLFAEVSMATSWVKYWSLRLGNAVPLTKLPSGFAKSFRSVSRSFLETPEVTCSMEWFLALTALVYDWMRKLIQMNVLTTGTAESAESLLGNTKCEIQMGGTEFHY